MTEQPIPSMNITSIVRVVTAQYVASLINVPNNYAECKAGSRRRLEKEGEREVGLHTQTEAWN